MSALAALVSRRVCGLKRMLWLYLRAMAVELVYYSSRSELLSTSIVIRLHSRNRQQQEGLGMG